MGQMLRSEPFCARSTRDATKSDGRSMEQSTSKALLTFSSVLNVMSPRRVETVKVRAMDMAVGALYWTCPIYTRQRRNREQSEGLLQTEIIIAAQVRFRPFSSSTLPRVSFDCLPILYHQGQLPAPWWRIVAMLNAAGLNMSERAVLPTLVRFYEQQSVDH